MGYILYGSKTSPLVRRIRLLLEQIPYDFKEINVFDSQDADELNKITPLNQIPVLKDGETKIWDSRQIFNYINSQHNLQKMSWEDENSLTAIDGMMDAGVTLLMLRRSGIDDKGSYMYLERQKNKIESVLNYLRPFILDRGMKKWDFHIMSLYSFIDWASFREITAFDQRPECLELVNQYKNQAIVQQTSIPRG